MLRVSSIVSVVASGLALAAPFSASHAETKIAVVNFSRLAEESPQAKTLQAALEREFGQRQRELLQTQTDLKTKESKLQRDGAVMGEAERNKAQKELVDGQRDFVRRQNEFKEDVELRRNEELGKLQRSLVQEVQTFAKGQNFDLILSADSVIFRKDALDITTQVVTAMQAENKGDKGGDKAKAPAAKP